MAVAAALTRLLVEKKSCYFQALSGTLLQHRKSSGGRSSRSQGLRLGETFERQAIFTHDQVEAFVLLTGDANPIHVLPKQNSVEEKEEEKKEKKKCIVPGMLCSSLFPAIIGSTFPGSLYLEQTLNFKNKVFVGDKVTARLVLTQLDGRRAKFQTQCFKQNDDDGDGDNRVVVIEGVARALIR